MGARETVGVALLGAGTVGTGRGADASQPGPTPCRATPAFRCG